MMRRLIDAACVPTHSRCWQNLEGSISVRLKVDPSLPTIREHCWHYPARSMAAARDNHRAPIGAKRSRRALVAFHRYIHENYLFRGRTHMTNVIAAFRCEGHERGEVRSVGG